MSLSLDFCVLYLFCVSKVKFTKVLHSLYIKRKTLVSEESLARIILFPFEEAKKRGFKIV